MPTLQPRGPENRAPAFLAFRAILQADPDETRAYIRRHFCAIVNAERFMRTRVYQRMRAERTIFDWVNRQFERQGLLPSSPFTKALNYVRARRLGLEVFLADPDVPIDTNHLERTLRAIPMGRKTGISAGLSLGPSRSASCKA